MQWNIVLVASCVRTQLVLLPVPVLMDTDYLMGRLVKLQVSLTPIAWISLRRLTKAAAALPV